MRPIITIFVLALPSLALAEGNAAKAEALFRDGRELLASGKLAEACAAFDASQRLEPATSTVFNQADCREKNGQLATAWGEFVEAERETRGTVDDTGTRMHAVAVERADKLEPRMSKLTIRVGAALAGLVVRRGGEVVDPGEWNRALPIDGGTYELTASLEDRQVWSETLTIGVEHDARTVEVTISHGARPPDAEPAAPAAAAHTTISAGVTALHAATAPAPERSYAWPLGVTLGAGVLLAGALAFDVWGNSTYDDAVAHHSVDDWNSANDKRYTAEGLLAAGLGCAGVATYLWLRDQDDSSHARTATVIAPIATGNFTGLQLAGRW